MHHRSTYTPQVVVDGGVGFVGSEAGRAHAAIAATATARLATISLTRTYKDFNTVALRIAIKKLPPDSADTLGPVRG